MKALSAIRMIRKFLAFCRAHGAHSTARCGAILGVLWLGSHPGPIQAQSAKADFDRAYQAEAAEHYAEAVRGYEQLIARYGYSAPVLFNLANAYFLQGNIGLAILNYERARLLAPRDPDIQANLQFVRQQAELPAPTRSWLERTAAILPLNTWAWLGSGALAGVCLALAARRLTRKWRHPLLALQAAGALTMLLAITAMAVGARNLNRAVALGPGLVARLSPVPSASAVYELAEGQLVSIRRRHGEFVLVQDREGRLGWVEAARVGTVIAPRSLAP